MKLKLDAHIWLSLTFCCFIIVIRLSKAFSRPVGELHRLFNTDILYLCLKKSNLQTRKRIQDKGILTIIVCIIDTQQIYIILTIIVCIINTEQINRFWFEKHIQIRLFLFLIRRVVRFLNTFNRYDFSLD